MSRAADLDSELENERQGFLLFLCFFLAFVRSFVFVLHFATTTTTTKTANVASAAVCLFACLLDVSMSCIVNTTNVELKNCVSIKIKMLRIREREQRKIE